MDDIVVALVAILLDQHPQFGLSPARVLHRKAQLLGFLALQP
ncbi:MAG TPA: hypothetical protein VMF87_23280 [Streptosporangiaceae bacterium]|nr:hypothetical protein [Streptosporangiaceae bacterium]